MRLVSRYYKDCQKRRQVASALLTVSARPPAQGHRPGSTDERLACGAVTVRSEDRHGVAEAALAQLHSIRAAAGAGSSIRKYG
jgi:hypothetical protein